MRYRRSICWWVPSRTSRTAAKPVHSARRHDRQETRTAGPLYEPAGPITAVAIAENPEGLRGRREHLSAASIYEGLGDATNERWNAPGFRERRHSPVRPCPHTVACGFRGRIGADGDAR